MPITFIIENTCWLKIGTTKWQSGCNFFGIVWSFTYIWWVLLQSLKMIIIKAISTWFLKFSVIKNVSIYKYLTILAKSAQVSIPEPCFLKLPKTLFKTLKSDLTGALFIRFCRSYSFFLIYHFGKTCISSIPFKHFDLPKRRWSNKLEFAILWISRHHLSFLYYF